MEHDIKNKEDFFHCKFPEYPVIPNKDAYFSGVTDLPVYPKRDLGTERNDMWDDFDGYEDFDPRK